MTILKGKNVQIIAEIEPTAGAADYTGSYKPVGKASEHSLSISRGSAETTTKDSGNFKGNDYDLGEGSGSINGLLFYEGSTIGVDELIAALIAGKKVKMVHVHVKEGAAPLDQTAAILTADIDDNTFLLGSKTTTFIAKLDSIEEGAPLEGKATYNLSFTLDGAPTLGTVPAAS